MYVIAHRPAQGISLTSQSHPPISKMRCAPTASIGNYTKVLLKVALVEGCRRTGSLGVQSDRAFPAHAGQALQLHFAVQLQRAQHARGRAYGGWRARVARRPPVRTWAPAVRKSSEKRGPVVRLHTHWQALDEGQTGCAKPEETSLLLDAALLLYDKAKA